MDTEFDLDFDLDEIDLDIGDITEPDIVLPSVYLLLENLVMLEQVKGLVEEAGDLVVVTAYAYKGEDLKEVGLIELTADNVLSMQLLGLKVSLIRENKSTILFDNADDFVAIIKTLKEGDTIDIADIDLPDNNDEQQ